MANNRLECKLPNGDVLLASYDGDRLSVEVETPGEKVVFRRKFTHFDMTGDPMFARQLPEEPSDTQSRNGHFTGGVHFGSDE